MSGTQPDQAATTHRLEGLEPDNLLGFLALLGLLRALETSRPTWRPRAAWSVDEPPLRPILHLREAQRGAVIAEAVAEGVTELAKDHVFPADVGEGSERQSDLNYPMQAARTFLDQAARSSPRRADVLASLMSDAAGRDGKVEATPMCLLFGQGHQHFLDRFSAVPAMAAPPPRGRGKQAKGVAPAECMAEAMFAPWERPDETPAFRWDPAEDVRYALQADDPSKARTLTQHGANRLAAVGLPALTCVPVQRSDRVRLGSLGGASEGGQFSMAWPIWSEPTSLCGLRALLGSPELRKPGGLAHLSVTEVRVARRISVGKFMNFGRGKPIQAAIPDTPTIGREGRVQGFASRG